MMKKILNLNFRFRHFFRYSKAKNSLRSTSSESNIGEVCAAGLNFKDVLNVLGLLRKYARRKLFPPALRL